VAGHEIGHIGGKLTCLYLLLSLHHLVFAGMDQFILSKDDAASALALPVDVVGRGIGGSG
jgi:hypothetical protein